MTREQALQILGLPATAEAPAIAEQYGHLKSAVNSALAAASDPGMRARHVQTIARLDAAFLEAMQPAPAGAASDPRVDEVLRQNAALLEELREMRAQGAVPLPGGRRVVQRTTLSARQWLIVAAGGAALLGAGALMWKLTRPQQQPPMEAAGQNGGQGTADGKPPWVNSLGMEFISVPGMPGLLMGRTETRVRDFRAFAETGPSEVNPEHQWKPAEGRTEDHPVTHVSYTEAQAFAAWLSRKEKLTYRLPTDEEWSAAAGSGKYPWGESLPPPIDAGNYMRPKEAYNGYFFTTAPVGSFKANRYGFFDLGGNVWEWCSDRFQASMNTDEVRRLSPVLETEQGEDGTPFYVARGASHENNNPTNMLTSFRTRGPAERRNGITGFRLVVQMAE